MQLLIRSQHFSYLLLDTMYIHLKVCKTIQKPCPTYTTTKDIQDIDSDESNPLNSTAIIER